MHNKIRKRLLDTFKELRKEKILPRANFMCCSKCASAVIWGSLLKEKHVGAVYWTRNDEEYFKQTGKIYLGYGSKDETDEKDILVGKQLVFKLRSFGLDVEWNGNPNEKVLVKGIKEA